MYIAEKCYVSLKVCYAMQGLLMQPCIVSLREIVAAFFRNWNSLNVRPKCFCRNVQCVKVKLG